MKPVAQIRRENLRVLIDREFSGNGAALASHLGKDRRQVSAWLNHKDMRDLTAREIEARCMKQSGWLDHEPDVSLKERAMKGTPSHPGRTDRQKMADAIRLLQELGELQGVPNLPLDPVALSVAYDFLVEFDTPLEESNVLDMTKRLAGRLRGEGRDEPERGEAD